VDHPFSRTRRLVIAGLTTIALLAVVAASPIAPASSAIRTRVVLLGTGTPNADPDRSGPAVAIVVDNTAYIVDAGPGVVRRAAAAARADSIPALGAARLRIVFITHLHSDHTLGLPDLMFSPWVLGRTVPLAVYGPPGTRAMVEHLQAAYAKDIEIRLHGGEPSNKTGYGGAGHDTRAGVVYRDSLVTVTAFEVPHGKWPHAFGYRFQTSDRTIVVSGDTRASDAVARACNGCDVLVHEVYTQKGFEAGSPAWQRYKLQYHTSPQQLGELAAKAKPKLLVLTHQIYQMDASTEEDLIKEMGEAYKGRFVSGHDLDIF